MPSAASSGCAWPLEHPELVGEGGVVQNYCAFDSNPIRFSKGQRLKTHSKALRDEIAEVSKPCSFPPPLPQPLSTPAGAERGAQQPYVANALSGVAFTCNGQHSNLPGTTGAWGHTDIACRHFEGWRFMVNSSTSNTQPHTVVGSPFSPGGVRGGGAVQELLHRRY